MGRREVGAGKRRPPAPAAAYASGVPLLKYTALRLGVFAVVFAVLYLAGLRSALLWVVAILVAALVSYIFFPKAGDRAAGEVQRLASHHKERAHYDSEEDFEEPGVAQHGDEVPADGPAHDGPADPPDGQQQHQPGQ